MSIKSKLISKYGIQGHHFIHFSDSIGMSLFWKALLSRLYNLEFIAFTPRKILSEKFFSGFIGNIRYVIFKVNIVMARAIVCENKEVENFINNLIFKPTSLSLSENFIQSLYKKSFTASLKDR